MSPDRMINNETKYTWWYNGAVHYYFSLMDMLTTGYITKLMRIATFDNGFWNEHYISDLNVLFINNLVYKGIYECL